MSRAAERTTSAWRHDPAGARLLDEAPERLESSSPDLTERLERMVRDWQGAVLDIVRSEARAKRSAARLMSYGVNAAGLVVMVAVFAHTGGLTGGEVAVAGGTSALAQKVLEALLGDQAVRDLAASARADLRRRVETLLAAERDRFTRLLDGSGLDAVAAGELHEAVRTVGRAR
jgi:hypothetical protein